MKPLTHIFWDLDGTLLDTGKSIMHSAAYALEQMGRPVPPESELRRFVGPPLAVSFAREGVPPEKVEEAVRTYRFRYHIQGAKFLCEPYAGIFGVLDRLRAAGLHHCVATSKPEVMARELLEKFGLNTRFDFIAGSTIDYGRDSKEAVIRYLLENIGGAENAVMVGDTEFDVRGAAAVGIPCIGVAWGYGTRETIRAAGAAAIVETPEELETLLLSGSGKE